MAGELDNAEEEEFYPRNIKDLRTGFPSWEWGYLGKWGLGAHYEGTRGGESVRVRLTNAVRVVGRGKFERVQPRVWGSFDTLEAL